MEFTWVDTTGGPHVLLPHQALPDWNGAPVRFDPGRREEWGDYGRACNVDGYIGLLSVGGVAGLVLGDEPGSTTFHPGLDILVRWIAADSEPDIIALAARGLSQGGWDAELSWDVPGSVLLFDSSLPGVAARDGLTVDLKPGRYVVRAAYVEDDGAACVIVNLEQEGKGSARPHVG